MTIQRRGDPFYEMKEEKSEAAKSFSASYMAKLGDFAKWTTTLAIGAMLWITNSFAGYPMSFRLPAIISLILLSLSLLSSLGIGAMTLYIEKKRWKSASSAKQGLLALIVETHRQGPKSPKPLDPKTLEWLENKRDRDFEEHYKASEAQKKALQITRSWILLLIRFGTLFLGLSAYAGLQVYHVLTFTNPLSP